MGLNNFMGSDPDAGNNGSGSSGSNGQGSGNGSAGIPIASIGGLGFKNRGGGFDPNEILINYNEKFKSASPIQYRDEVTFETLSILIGQMKPNPLLIGQAGVGKTKIIEEIARRLANDDPLIPDALKGYTVYELPISHLIAGSGIVGELEEKVKSLLDFVTKPKNKVILFIDEIHQLTDSRHHAYESIAQMLKPALARSDMHLIGATTLQEANGFLDDPAFSRRFSRVIVDELSREQTFDIVSQAKNNYIMSKVAVSDDTVKSIVHCADEYKRNAQHRPDNALTLLDRAACDKIIARKVLEESLKDDPVKLKALQAVTVMQLTEDDVKKTAIRLMTGSNKRENTDMESLEEALSVIRGQEDAVNAMLDIIARYNLDIFPREKPMTILFGGTSGVGKTEVTKIIAKEMTGVKPIILNMTEYNSPATINRIIGAPAGYVGSDSNAELPFDCLESNPYQIILLDEFEKCDKAVQRLFMQVFDEGRLKTNRGNEVDFTKTIIVATTNAGYTTQQSLGFGRNDDMSATSDLKHYFDVELLNRFAKIIEFKGIDKETYREICANQYASLIAYAKSSSRRITLPDTIPDDDLDELVEASYDVVYGARPAKRTIQAYIEDKLL